MKVKIALLISAVIAVAFAIALLVTRQKAADRQAQDAERIAYNSNQWQQVQVKLEDEKQTNTRLNQDLDAQKQVCVELTNTYMQVSGKLAQAETTLASTAASLKAAQEKITQDEAKIAALEAQSTAQEQLASELTGALTNLTAQIEDTRRKLAASEGDKAFLEQELKRLMAEKAELERQFNDLKVLRAQVAKLKEELNISRRWEWIRKGLSPSSDLKGASMLLQGANAPSRKAPPAAHYDLNVEVNSDGSVRVIPPLTNTPAAKPPSN